MFGAHQSNSTLHKIKISASYDFHSMPDIVRALNFNLRYSIYIFSDDALIRENVNKSTKQIIFDRMREFFM